MLCCFAICLDGPLKAECTPIARWIQFEPANGGNNFTTLGNVPFILLAITG